jgi:hypothetical protein
MATKRVLAFVFAFALGAGVLAAQQWRQDVANLFGKGKNYKAIAETLEPIYGWIDEAQRPDAAAILALCAGRQGDVQGEMRWISEFFEKGRGKDSDFVFLDFINQADIIGYLNVWRMRYPFVSEIALVRGIGNEALIPQGLMPIVIDISSEAYYKFSQGANVLQAGQFKPGINIIGLDAAELFLNPGSRTFLLEMKTGNLILKKEIDLDVEVLAPARIPRPTAEPVPGRPVDYTVSMYVGGELVMKSHKTETPLNWKTNVPVNTNTWGWKPDVWINRDKDPLAHAIDIPAAISYLYGLLKELFTKKSKPEAPAPQVETVHDLSLTYPIKDSDGRAEEMKISLKLRTRNLPFVLNAP